MPNPDAFITLLYPLFGSLYRQICTFVILMKMIKMNIYPVIFSVCKRSFRRIIIMSGLMSMSRIIRAARAKFMLLFGNDDLVFPCFDETIRDSTKDILYLSLPPQGTTASLRIKHLIKAHFRLYQCCQGKSIGIVDIICTLTQPDGSILLRESL